MFTVIETKLLVESEKSEMHCIKVVGDFAKADRRTQDEIINHVNNYGLTPSITICRYYRNENYTEFVVTVYKPEVLR